MIKNNPSLTNLFVTGIRTQPLSQNIPGKKNKVALHRLLVCLFVLFIAASPTLCAQTVAISGNTIVCANSSQMYTTSYTSGYTYVWSVLGAAGNSSSSNSLAVTYGQPPIASSGNVLITLVVLDGNGITVSTGSLIVHVNPTPQPEILTLSSVGCSAPPIDYDGTIPLIDSTVDYCYKVCDSTVFKYQVGATFDPSHTYQWTVIPASAAIAITTTPSTGNADVYWGAPSGANSYILRLSETDPVTGCSDSVDICVRIIPRPNASFTTFPAPDVSGIVHICFNSAVAFFDQSTADPNSMIVSYLWDFGDGIYSTQQFPTHTYASPGTFYAKLVVENQCHCRDSLMVQIDVDGQPGADIYCISPRCYNTSDTYCTSWTCGPYNWSVTNGTITSPPSYSNCIDINWGTNGPGSIVFTPDPSCGGCPYPTSVLVPILTPTTSITGANPACENSRSFYSVPNVPATTYNWQLVPSNSGTIISGQGTNQMSVFFGAGPINCSVQVVYTNLFLGCSGSAELAVKVAPKMTLVGDSIVCSGVTGSYATNSSSANWWVVSATGTTSIGSGVSGVSYSFPSSGAYVIFAQDLTGGFCATPQAYQVQVIAQPSAPTATFNTIICSNTVFQYLATPTNNNYFLHWAVTGGTPNQTSGNAISVVWGTSGPWSITLTQEEVMPPGCASSPLVINMSLPTVPPPTINTSNTAPCFNQSVNYSTPASADYYTWQLAPSTIGSIAQGAGTNNITIQYNNDITPQTASLSLIVESCGVTNTTVLTFTIGVPSAPAIVVPNICQNQPATFGTSPSPTGTYAWAFGDGGTGSGSSSAHTYTAVSPYTVSLTVTNPNGCIGTVFTSTIISINPSPVANITSPDPLTGGCPTNQPFPYTLYASAQTIAGTPSYTWDLNGSFYAGNVNSTTINQAGLYTMSVTLGGCTSTTAVNVTTNCGQPAPCTNNSVSISHTLSCTTATFAGTTTGSGGAITSWLFPDGSTSSAANPVFTFPASGYYHVYVTAVWNGTCQATFDYVIAVPVQAAFKYDFSCGSPGLNVSFIDQSNWIPGTSVTYAWTSTVSTAPFPTTAQNPTPTNMTAGTYTVSVAATGGGQTCVETQTVIVAPTPTAGFTATSSICEGNPVIFNNTSSPTSGIAQYLWDFGDGTSLITQNSPGPNGIRVYVFNPSNPNPPANLTITDVYGCQSSFGSISVQTHSNSFNISANYAVVSPTLSQICDGGTVNICASSANPNTPLSYMWNTFATTSCVAATQAGIYSVVLTDVYGCKSNRPFASVNVITVPPPVVFGKQSYCLGSTPLLSINKGTGYNYQWVYETTDATMISATGSYTSTACSSPLFPPPPSSCALSPSLNANATGTLSLAGLITETSSGLNCQAQWGVVTITIHPLPPAPTVASNGCETGGLIALSATPTGTGVVSSIMWNTGQQGSSINVIPAGPYWAAVVDNYGCVSEADTVNIWTLPNFNPLIYGCYDICDTGTIVVPVPSGNSNNYYTSYTWIKQGYGDVAGPNSFYTPLVLTNPSTMPGGNAGVYQLALTTNHGCTDTSKTIEFNVKTCVGCNSGDYTIQLDDIVCVYDPITGAPSYNFQVTVNNTTASSHNFTLTTGNGILNLIPVVTILNPGANVLTGNFIPVLGVQRLCIHFAIQINIESSAVCGQDFCIDLPVCEPQLPPCGLRDTDLQTRCLGIQNGMATYGYNLNFTYSGNTGTITLSTYQGFMDQSTTIVNTGANNITGTFTDTPSPDGIFCVDVVIKSMDADGNITWCQDRICVKLDPNPPCKPNLTPCPLTINTGSSVCYYVNSYGEIAYVINYDITNTSSSTYSFYVMSSQGMMGVPSPASIYPTATTSYTQSFLEITPSNPQCFSIIATDLSTGKQCEIDFCINPQPCDPSQLRLISTAEVNLYPNPTEDYTIAEYVLDNKELANKLCLVDMSGRIVQEIQLKDTRGKVEINTTSLQAGMYFLKAMNGNQTVLVKKLIIQR